MGDSNLIAGLDEVGMGCIAGPVVVAVVAFPQGVTRIAGVKDSKKCTKLQREKLAPDIVRMAAYVGFGFASAKTINRRKLAAAWQIAADMALSRAPEFKRLIVDGNRPVDRYIGHQRVRPKADALHWEVSAASIIAKTLRDMEMEELAEEYPFYGWEKNSGYPTEEHRDGVIQYGMTPFHRVSATEKSISK